MQTVAAHSCPERPSSNRGTRFANSAPMPARPLLSLALATMTSFCLCSSVWAQQEPGQPAQDPTSSAPAAPVPQEKPAWLQGRELDEVLVNLPTTLPLKKHKSYFRITHRFARDLRRG